jgi:hypothetical protein
MYEDLKRYTRWLSGWFLVMYFLVVLIGKSPMGRDDSDPGEWGQRSGITPRTDHLTGCQYLEAVSGGLTPRLDKTGKHIGCR